MLFLRRPTAETTRAFLAAQARLNLTYAAVGATTTAPPAGYAVDHTRIKLGEGDRVFQAAKSALERWEHFNLGWVEAYPADTPIKVGQVVASEDFMVSPRAALYLNAGFGTYPTFTANINAPTYPLGGPGALAAWQVAEAFSVQSGVYVGDAGPNDGGNDGFGWRQGFCFCSPSSQVEPFSLPSGLTFNDFAIILPSP